MSSRKSRFIQQIRYSHVPKRPRDVEKERDEEDREIKKGKISKNGEVDGDIFSDDDDDAKDCNKLKIKKIKSCKDDITNPILSEQDIIPRLGTSSIMNGTTGQGKSTLLTNIVSSKRFFGGLLPNGKAVFTHKFLVSPTAEGDDVQKKLGIDEEDTFTDLEEAPDLIRVIMDAQKKKVKDLGSDKAPQVLLVYDDVISNPLFMRTDEFTKSFIASRHYNLTTFVCSQSWTAVPRRCRLQAKNIFFFASPLSEVELLCQEYCPPNMTKKQFMKMVDYCTSEPYSFLYINKSVPMEKRFRKNLGEMINLKFFQSLNITRENELKSNSVDDSTNQGAKLQALSVNEPPLSQQQTTPQQATQGVGHDFDNV